MAAGVFVPDPALGFPPGTPEGPPATFTWHGIMHYVSATPGFLSLVIACFMLARRFSAEGDRGWAAYSIAAGVIFFVAFAGISSGASNAIITVGFTAGIFIAWTWISALCARLHSRSADA